MLSWTSVSAQSPKTYACHGSPDYKRSVLVAWSPALRLTRNVATLLKTQQLQSNMDNLQELVNASS